MEEVTWRLRVEQKQPWDYLRSQACLPWGPKGVQYSSCPCQGARYGSHLGCSRWFQPQPIAAEQQMNFPVDSRNEKDNKTTVILTHTVWRWAVLFPDNRQPKHWGIKDLVIRSGVSLDSLPARGWRQELPAGLFQHLIHTCQLLRLASRLEPSTISSSCFFKVSS